MRATPARVAPLLFSQDFVRQAVHGGFHELVKTVPLGICCGPVSFLFPFPYKWGKSVVVCGIILVFRSGCRSSFPWLHVLASLVQFYHLSTSRTSIYFTQTHTSIFVQYSVLQLYLCKYIMIIRKGVVEMSKKKRRRKKPAALARKQIAADILAGTISGLIVLAIQKLLNW